MKSNINVVIEQKGPIVNVEIKDQHPKFDVSIKGSGPPGKDGSTPKRGVDYWTDSDKNEIVIDVTNQVQPLVNKAESAAKDAEEYANQALGSALPPATGVPDGYALQTQGGRPIWESISQISSSGMEFINSITIQEDSSSGKIDVDSSGEKFSLSEAVATVSFGADQKTSLFYWYFTNGIDFYVNSTLQSGTSPKIAVFANNLIGMLTVLQTTGANSKIEMKLVEPGIGITMFRFANFNGVPLKSGTVIKLYGKRK